jgi:endonuclease G
MMMKRINEMKDFLKSINRSVVAVLMLVLSFTACVEPEWSPYTSNAEINSVIVSAQGATVSGTTVGDPMYTWTLSVVEGADFCSAVTRAGFAGQEFSLKFTANTTDQERTARATITFSDGFSKTFTVRQLVMSANPEYDKAWAEQPYQMEGANLIHKTYYTTLNDNRRVRNFSICYDTDKICSRWVAYPAHKIYTSGRDYEVGGSTAGRTNAWAFDDAVTQYKYNNSWSKAYEIISTYVPELDTYNTYTNPIIPQSKQADIVGSNGFGYGYARGHMLPSADRYNTWNTNAQTCYATNIMVQDYDFNSASWGTLENKVRTKICADTLYVVVGTLFEHNTTISKYGRTISVPSHCFKMLLRTKSGSTGKHISDIKSADELMCIGFLFENNNGSKGGQVQLKDAAVSVSEIESRSGFTFFHNLDPKIAEEVKAQCNFSDWKF